MVTVVGEVVGLVKLWEEWPTHFLLLYIPLEEQLRQAIIDTEATLIFTSLIQLASLSLTYIITAFTAALFNLCSNGITFDLNH